MENDQDRIIRIIVNMLLNAQKFTQSGFIKFQVRQIINKRNTKGNNASLYPNLVKFELQDTGLGIPEEKLPFIFNLFESDYNNIQNLGQQNNQKCNLYFVTFCSC